MELDNLNIEERWLQKDKTVLYAKTHAHTHTECQQSGFDLIFRHQYITTLASLLYIMRSFLLVLTPKFMT